MIFYRKNIYFASPYKNNTFTRQFRFCKKYLSKLEFSYDKKRFYFRIMQ